MLRSFVIVALLGCALAAAPTKAATDAKAQMRHTDSLVAADEALLNARVGAGAAIEQTAFSSANAQKGHGHSPHGHSPHGHNPHRHYPHRHYPHRHYPFGDTVS